MKNTLLGLLIAVFTFYFGLFVQNFFYWENVNVKQLEISTFGEELFEVNSHCSFPSENLENENNTENEYLLTPAGIYFPTNEKGLESETAIIIDFFENRTIGMIKIESKMYECKSAFADENKVVLKTRKHRGIEYKFEGRFFKNGFKEYFEEGETVLKGTLQKSVNGKKVYKIKKEFLFVVEVCAWGDEELTFIK